MTDSPIVPLILVDGSSYLYRAYHALPPLATAKGQPTGAVRGVISMLRVLQKDYPKSLVVVVFDAKGKTFRDALFADYKSQRPPMPDDLRPQVQPIYDIVTAMGLPLLVVDGVEADDVIGTLAQQAAKNKQPVIISTGDKDMAQLVDPHITLVNTMTKTVLDVVGVEQKYGIPPALIIDFLALMGDKVDNIPGVPGIGEKTALALLQGLGSLDAIYQNLDAVGDLGFRGAKKMPEKLAKHEQQARLSYQLATIKTDVQLPVAVADLQQNQPDEAGLLALYTHLEFKSWVAELATDAVSDPQSEVLKNSDQSTEVGQPVKAKVPAHYTTIATEAALDTWINALAAADYFAFDTETTSLDYMAAKIVGVSFAVKPGEAAYVPCAHDYLGAPKQLALDYVLTRLKPLLEDPDKAKLGQNLKYDRNVLLNYGICLKGIAFDTMLESYVLNSTASRHDMDSLAAYYLDRETIHFTDIAGKGAKQLTFNQIPVEQASPYAAEDADITLQLHQVLSPQFVDKPELGSVLATIEIPLVPVLSDIERQGALIDAGLLQYQSQEISERLHRLEKQSYELAGEAFNLSSPKQLGAILFDKLDLPIIKKTPKGAPSTAEDVLQTLAQDYPLPKVLMEYRGLSKLKSTYTDKLPSMINLETGRVHTSYHQAVAATGRLSSTDPNLQNIPIKTAQGRRIRQAFIAPEHYQIVAADYSQIELRIMAHLSGDQGLKDAFNQNLDVHRATAAEVFGVALDAVSEQQRRSAKAINFGLIYGMSAFGLAKQLGLGRKEAQQYIDRYFERYPGVKHYMADIRQRAAEQGYVETLFGRRLYLPEINARNAMRRQGAERTAINAPMQGTAADIIKKAMIAVHQWLQQTNQDARIIMQVHDELVLEVHQSIIDTLPQQLCTIMSSAAQLVVPLVVDAGIGDNWDQAH
ncbi:MAG: DNA polymerase I [Cellvibrionaceae bacterium]|nr:DNA polymerase I [Cellvibrionaceae bacterium]